MVRFINPGDFSQSQAFYQQAHSIAYSENIMGRIGCTTALERSLRQTVQNKLERHLVAVFHACGPDLEGKVILDLGCGSNKGTYETNVLGPQWNGVQWRPWLCRTLHALGAQPLGIDIGSLAGEQFRHYQRDLTKKRALRGIPGSSVDVVCAFSFLDSPGLELCLENNRSGSPTFEAPYYARRIMGILIPQIRRVLKPDGAFVHSESWDFEVNENGLVEREYAYPPSW